VPVPAPAPAPGPETPQPPEPEPELPQGPTDVEKLEANPGYKAAKELYSKAEDLYKTNFAGKTAEQKQGLRDSRKALEKARGILEKFPQDLGEAAGVFDALSQKILSLLHDVEKRQGATGS
ncbi:MAG: hypothetical protein ACAI25_13055, partial [Planctomycetota bacterium]